MAMIILIWAGWHHPCKKIYQTYLSQQYLKVPCCIRSQTLPTRSDSCRISEDWLVGFHKFPNILRTNTEARSLTPFWAFEGWVWPSGCLHCQSLRVRIPRMLLGSLQGVMHVMLTMRKRAGAGDADNADNADAGEVMQGTRMQEIHLMQRTQILLMQGMQGMQSTVCFLRFIGFSKWRSAGQKTRAGHVESA